MVHGNGERASTTSPWRASSSREAALGPVVHVPGRVAEILHVRAARHVEPAPERLARDRDQQVAAAGAARHLRHRVLGVGHVLEHLDRRRERELAVRERERLLRAQDAVLEVRRRALLPLGPQHRVLEVEADDPRRRPRDRPLVGEDRLAAADVEHRRRVDPLEQLAERALERRHQPPDDRVLRAVLVVGVAGDRALGVARDGRAHSLTASRSSVSPWPPAFAPVVGSRPLPGAPGS